MKAALLVFHSLYNTSKFQNFGQNCSVRNSNWIYTFHNFFLLGEDDVPLFRNIIENLTRTKRFIRSEAKSKLFLRTELYINKNEKGKN